LNIGCSGFCIIRSSFGNGGLSGIKPEFFFSFLSSTVCLSSLNGLINFISCSNLDLISAMERLLDEFLSLRFVWFSSISTFLSGWLISLFFSVVFWWSCSLLLLSGLVVYWLFSICSVCCWSILSIFSVVCLRSCSLLLSCSISLFFSVVCWWLISSFFFQL